MIITKKHISRRQLLRGTGVALSMPLLDAMIPVAIPIKNIRAVKGKAERYLLRNMYPITPMIIVKIGQRRAIQTSSLIGMHWAGF